MQLSELIGLRPEPCAGLLMTLTRRCPLSCAHCSTSATPAGEEPDAAHLVRFVSSFTAEDRPDVLLLTGGEPLLRPELTADLAAAARAAGTRTALLSGMFFARGGRLPGRILRTITATDHFSASLDVHHEREVPRADVFRAVLRVQEAGVPVSFHLTGRDDEDPYLAEVTDEIRRTFDDRVPVLVNRVRAVGRAASWATATRTGPDPARAVPCTMAAWPVVAFDGTVLACCNQRTVDLRPAPAHLRLGHIAEDSWPAVRARSLASPVLRLIRVLGPAQLRARYTPAGQDAAGCGEPGYCDGCHGLPERPEWFAGAARDASGALGAFLDQWSAARQSAAGPEDLIRRHGSVRYADLVSLGAPARGTP